MSKPIIQFDQTQSKVSATMGIDQETYLKLRGKCIAAWQANRDASNTLEAALDECESAAEMVLAAFLVGAICADARKREVFSMLDK